jgi:hypothetical protein
LKYNKQKKNMQNKRNHKKPEVTQQSLEAANVAKQMYRSLTLKNAPKATPQAYVAGACMVLKILVEQACQQGTDKDVLLGIITNFTNDI